MSHELRTPLNAILGFAQLMQRDGALPEHQRDNLAVIGRSGTHLLELINDVLEFSKIEAGQTNLVPTRFDLHRTLDELEEMMRLRTEHKGLQLICERADNVPQFIETDQRKLRQILINLLTNAVKFTEQGGITLRCRCQPQETSSSSADDRLSLHFEIQDSGIGMTSSEQEILFEAFTQTKSGQRAQEGTGLGLPISRQFVQLMGGDISVHSQLGSGSIFMFNIQIKRVDVADIQLPHPTRQVIGIAPGQPDYRILIVDDNVESRVLLSKLLESVGLTIFEAENGQQAVDLYERWHPHLIWMDMRMPILNGYEATQQIKATARGQATTVIALTASVFEEDRTMILSNGCDDFVRKPFRADEIFEKMEKHLGVRYIYEETTLAKPNKRSSELMALTPEALACLPSTWLTDLHNAAIQGEMEQLLLLIDQIEDKHSQLAPPLTKLVQQFRFDKLVALTQNHSDDQT
ncbi:response regulator [Chloroflexi bacterium TSY]|nr:response regulator [Chloroflexi bacterium TSY]